MSAIECGWLSWPGKFTACKPYDHLAIAEELANGMALYSVADDYLLDHGYVKIYRESFCGHKWFIAWRGFLSEAQKSYLRPIFEDAQNDIHVHCRECWENEN